MTTAAQVTSSSTDRIERSILIKATRSRVWQALSSAEAFGNWFGVNLKGKAFVPGERVQGPLTIKAYEHCLFDIVVDRIEPEHLMAYRWHPYAMDPAIDYEREPRTVVTFTLKEAGADTLLTVTESGFDHLPPGRRLEAFRMNTRGWDAQVVCLEKYATAR